MADNVIKLRRKPRPLRKTYDPAAPYEVEREDRDSGVIAFNVTDVRPDSYRDICCIDDDGNPYAKHDAEQIARALNMMVALGKERLPKVKQLVDRDLEDLLRDDLRPDDDEDF